jgi:cytochrome c553
MQRLFGVLFILRKRGAGMRTLKEQLHKWNKKNNVLKEQKKKKRKKKAFRPKQYKEKLSDRDLQELMGIYRPTYSRGRGGAYRQK